MSRALTLGLVLAASMAVGMWLFRADPPRATEPCDEGSVCETTPRAAAENPDAPVQAPVETSKPPPAPSAVPPASPPAVNQRAAAPPAPALIDAIALRSEADRLLAEGHAEEGLEALRKATEADPSAKNHGDLGALLQRLTAPGEAVIHLKRAAELDPGNANRWIDLANAYYQSVNPGEAWEAERKAREAEPGLVLGRDASGMRVRKGDSGASNP